MDNLKNTEKIAKEMTEFCQKVVVSVTNSLPPVLVVVITALTGPLGGNDKGQGFWMGHT